jgi:tRNA/rRNA methyltransferase
MPDFRVVLVRPHFAGNIGAVARVMHNFGAAKLTLVDPVADPLDAEACRLATHGEFILHQTQIVTDLPTALSDCVLAAATSAKVEGVERQTGAGTLRQIAPILAASGGPVALVFGPEPSGLTTAETNLCHYLIHIPTNPAFAALNLAQAVAITLYELHATHLPATTTEVASFAEQERMFEHLREALAGVHFLFGPKADALMHAVRHLIGRAQPTPGEVKILHGLARQLEWVAEHGLQKPRDSFDPHHP